MIELALAFVLAALCIWYAHIARKTMDRVAAERRYMIGELRAICDRIARKQHQCSKFDHARQCQKEWAQVFDLVQRISDNYQLGRF